MKRKVIIPFIVIMAVAIALTVVMSIQGNGAAKKIASVDEKKVETAFDAKEVASSTCAGCHGVDLKGGVGPDLTGVKERYSADELKGILLNGKGSGMPKGLVPAGDVDKMVQYLQTL